MIAESISNTPFDQLGLKSITFATWNSDTLPKLKMGTADLGTVMLYSWCKGKLLEIVAMDSTNIYIKMALVAAAFCSLCSTNFSYNFHSTFYTFYLLLSRSIIIKCILWIPVILKWQLEPVLLFKGRAAGQTWTTTWHTGRTQVVVSRMYHGTACEGTVSGSIYCTMSNSFKTQ